MPNDAETSGVTDARVELVARAGIGVAPKPAVRGPFTLAALLDLDDAALAEPLPRIAPPEHRWEQLSLDVTHDGSDMPPSLRSADVTLKTPDTGMQLVPGLDAPGACEVPVYLAGRALDAFLNAPAPMHTAEPSVEPHVAAPSVDVAPLAPGTGSTRRRSSDPPSASFSATPEAPVLWPRQRATSRGMTWRRYVAPVIVTLGVVTAALVISAFINLQ
ncbi:MAG TPA: hypothetical protein VE861_04825 [Gemmatimonadaceae bacterium]|nr:hypothetical protein [Gemmatimonadaceae bacterium]